MSCSNATNCTRYLRGLADFYVMCSGADRPYDCVTDGESLTDLTAQGASVISLVTTPVVRVGSYSVQMTPVATAGDGVLYTFPATVDWSGILTYWLNIDIYPTTSGNIQIEFDDGTNQVSVIKSVDGGGFNRVPVQLSALTGTFNWNTLTSISITQSGAGALGTTYLDGIELFAELSDMSTPLLARVGCTKEMGIELNEDFAELKCSDGSVVQRESLGKDITLTATIQDFDPNGVSVLTNNALSTTSVTRLIENEAFAIPNVANPQYTLAYASQLKFGEGFGVFVTNSDGCLLQEFPDNQDVPSGYFNVDPTTGTLTFADADKGKDAYATYNVVVPNGTTMAVNFLSDVVECAVQFRIKGANNQQVLYFFPRVHAVQSNINPALDEFWTWEFNGKVLADPITGEVYQVHYSNGLN